MARKSKDPKDMTSDELARFVFPKPVVDEAKRLSNEANEKQQKKGRKPSRSSRD